MIVMDVVNEGLANISPQQKDAMRAFAGDGIGWDNQTDNPVIFFAGTPQGTSFNKE